MARVRVVTEDRATALAPARAGIESLGFLSGDRDPLHLVQHRLEAGASIEIAGRPSDAIAYVWSGSVSAAGVELTRGASLVAEHGAAIEVVAGADGAVLLVFGEAQRAPDARSGGHVHLLPRSAVPTAADLGTQNGMGGGLHADAACPTCAIWLHENDFHAPEGTVVPIHSHSEHEIIFVTAGHIRLGNRTFGEGTAIAVAADTRYGFYAAPTGLSFINFRAASPTVTTSRGVSDEAAMWRARLGRPAYRDVAGAAA